jgi:peptide subunit release factor RF-3
VRISRMLAAVDSAVRVLDAAPMAPRGRRGADPQALRGLPACDLPIITLVNKPRPARPRITFGINTDPHPGMGTAEINFRKASHDEIRRAGFNQAAKHFSARRIGGGGEGE